MPRDLRKGRRLEPGDTIGVIAPAMHVFDDEALDRGIAALEAMGFGVELGPHVLSKLGRTTAPAADRAREIPTMFARPDVKAIVCLTGEAALRNSCPSWTMKPSENTLRSCRARAM